MPTAQLTLGRPAVHRVVGREREGNDLLFATEGDANGTADRNPVPAENVVSKVGFRVPYLGYVSQFVRSGLGITLLLLIAGSVIIFKGVRNIRHESLQRYVAVGYPEILRALPRQLLETNGHLDHKAGCSHYRWPATARTCSHTSRAIPLRCGGGIANRRRRPVSPALLLRFPRDHLSRLDYRTGSPSRG